MTDSVPGAFPAAVLWDMDGTLIDTEPFWIQAEYEMVETHGGTWTDTDAHHLVGSDLLDTAAYVKQVGGVDLDPADIINALMDRVIELMAGSPPWRPGALELLHALHDEGIPSALVTMSWRTLADAVVDLLPRGELFSAVVVGDEVRHGKPHPEPYLAAARKLGVEPTACIALEDSPTGAMSASAAGCTVIGVPHVVEIPEAATHLMIPSLTQLDVAALRRLLPA
jgi:HAD superfamily hydrolase (TIGR01509 family)